MEVYRTHFDPQVLEQCNLKLHDGGVEAVLAFLRMTGRSKMSSIVWTAHVMNISLSDAKEIVDLSRTWSDRLESDRLLTKMIIQALDETSKPPA